GQEKPTPFVYLGDVIAEEVEGRVRLKLMLEQLDQEALATKADAYDSVEIRQDNGQLVMEGRAAELRELLKMVELEVTPSEIASLDFQYELDLVEAQPLQHRMVSERFEVSSATI